MAIWTRSPCRSVPRGCRAKVTGGSGRGRDRRRYESAGTSRAYSMRKSARLSDLPASCRRRVASPATREILGSAMGSVGGFVVRQRLFRVVRRRVPACDNVSVEPCRTSDMRRGWRNPFFDARDRRVSNSRRSRQRLKPCLASSGEASVSSDVAFTVLIQGRPVR